MHSHAYADADAWAVDEWVDDEATRRLNAQKARKQAQEAQRVKLGGHPEGPESQHPNELFRADTAMRKDPAACDDTTNLHMEGWENDVDERSLPTPAFTDTVSRLFVFLLL